MKVGDLVKLKTPGNPELSPGLGVIVEIENYEGWYSVLNALFFRVMWGNDPYGGKVSPEDWIYCEQDLELIRK